MLQPAENESMDDTADVSELDGAKYKVRLS